MWVIYALLIVIAAIILLLCIPVDFAFSINTGETPKFKANFVWFFGLIKSDLRKQRPKKEKAKKQRERRPRRVSNLDLFFQTVTNTSLLREIFVFVKRTLKSAKIKELTGDLEIGLDDPIDNAWLFAFAMPLNYLLARAKHSLYVRPVFASDYYFSCVSSGRIRMYPIQMIGNASRLAFSGPIRNLSWKMVKLRWK